MKQNIHLVSTRHNSRHFGNSLAEMTFRGRDEARSAVGGEAKEGKPFLGFPFFKKPDNTQAGVAAASVIVVLGLLVLLLGGLSGVLLMRSGTQSSEEQIAAAAAQAKEQQRTEDQTRFDKERANPFRIYAAPPVFGDISIKFPKHWNLYVEDATGSGTNIDLFMNPDLVRLQEGTDTTFAFRLQLNAELFDEQNQDFARDSREGELKASTITVSGIEGVLYEGEIAEGHDGQLVVLPYRDKSIVMWTESRQYLEQFKQILEQIEISR